MSEALIDPEDEQLIEGEDADEEEQGDVDQQPGRLEEREQRQHATQQHGDEFAVDVETP